MRVIPLGVNSAFATGTYVEAVPVSDLMRAVSEMKAAGVFSNNKSEYLLNAIKTCTHRLYNPKWQSNFLIEFDCPGKLKDNVYRFVIDFGGDIRHSLAAIGLKLADIDGWYCSHPHADHIGGVEGIALSTFFNPYYTPSKMEWMKAHSIYEDANKIPAQNKPDLFAHRSVIEEIWRAAAPGLETLQGVLKVSLSTYFNEVPLMDNVEYQMKDGSREWKYHTVVSTHVISGAKYMPSYGLMFYSSDGKVLYFPTDCQALTPPAIKLYYDRAQIVYQDCETGPVKSGVHAHIDDLKQLPADLKNKMYLYHYTDEPKVDNGEFKGILKAGEIHTY